MDTTVESVGRSGDECDGSELPDGIVGHDAGAGDPVTVGVEVLGTGSVSVDESLPYETDTRHPLPQTGWLRPASRRVWVPVSAYLIEHPEGVVLVDTGWHTDVRTDARGHLGRLVSTIHGARLPPGEAVDEQLAARGLAPSDLAAVVVTHLHLDHVSGLDLVREAPRILASEPALAGIERRLSPNRLLAGRHWRGIEFEPFALAETGIGPFGRSHDLLGDGSVHLVWVPGHDDGQVAVLARTEDGPVLLASDAAYGARSVEEGIPPGVVTDREAAVRSLAWVRAVRDRSDTVAVLATHDPDVRPGRVTRETPRVTRT